MPDVSIKDLKRAARELNNHCGLKPLIDLLADEDKLTEQIKEAALELEADDFEKVNQKGEEKGFVSDETKATLEALDVDLPKPKEEKEPEKEPEEKEKPKRTKKEVKEELETDPEPKPKPSKKKDKEEKVPKKSEKAEKEKPKKEAKEAKKEKPKKAAAEEKLPAGYVRAEEAAKMLGFDEKRQVRILARKGKLPSKKDGTRVLFKVSDLEKYKAKMKSEKGKKSDE